MTKHFAIYAETHRDGYYGTGVTTHYSFAANRSDGARVGDMLAVEISGKTLIGYASLPDEAEVGHVMGGEVVVFVDGVTLTAGDIVKRGHKLLTPGVGFKRAEGWQFED